MTVAIIDDHEIVRDGLQLLANREPGIEFVGGAEDQHSGIQLVHTRAPELVLLDLMFAGRPSWSLLGRLVAECPDTKVAIYSAYGNADLVREAFDRGARGYLLKRSHTKDLARALRIVIEQQYVDPELAARMSEAVRLSTVEIEVLARIAAGYDNYAIAEDLHFSSHAVKYHIAAMLQRTGAHNRAELVRIGRDLHLLPEPE